MTKKIDIADTDLQHADWRSAGDNAGNASQVEVARIPGGMAMRDSDHPDGPILLFTDAEWAAFLAGVRDGELR